MQCPNCGNEVYELLDYAIARCTNCYSLWDPYVYPGFPTPNVSPGEIWDTSEPEEDDTLEDGDELYNDSERSEGNDSEDNDAESDEADNDEGEDEYEDWEEDQADEESDIEEDSEDWDEDENY